MGCLQIGIGPNTNYSELRSMASAPASSNVLVYDDFSSLTDDLVFQISSLVCRSTLSKTSFLRKIILADALSQTEDQRTVLNKNIKQLNRVSISVSLWLGLWLVSGLGLVLGLLLGLMPSSDIVLKSTVLSSSCVPTHYRPTGCITTFSLTMRKKNQTAIVQKCVSYKFLQNVVNFST